MHVGTVSTKKQMTLDDCQSSGWPKALWSQVEILLLIITVHLILFRGIDLMQQRRHTGFSTCMIVFVKSNASCHIYVFATL